jgi:hypothetical protein
MPRELREVKRRGVSVTDELHEPLEVVYLVRDAAGKPVDFRASRYAAKAVARQHNGTVHEVRIMTDEAAAVLAAAEAFITSERGDNTVELYLALASATNAYRAAKGEG